LIRFSAKAPPIALELPLFDPDRLLGAVGQPHHFEGSCDALGRVRDVVERGGEAEVLPAADLLVERGLLRHQADLKQRFPRPSRDVPSEDLHLTLGGRKQSAHYVDEGRLSGAVRPHDPDDLAGLDRHRKAIEGGRPAKANDQLLGKHRVRHAATIADGYCERTIAE